MLPPRRQAPRTHPPDRYARAPLLPVLSNAKLYPSKLATQISSRNPHFHAKIGCAATAAAAPHTLSSPFEQIASDVDDVWNLKTLEVHEIFHDQIDTLVSEVLVLQNMGAVEETLEVVRKHYITQARELKLPILFLFNLTDQTIGGLHYSGMIACADKKGVRWFEPSRGGIRERNLPMAKRVLQFLENNSSELNVGEMINCNGTVAVLVIGKKLDTAVLARRYAPSAKPRNQCAFVCDAAVYQSVAL